MQNCYCYIEREITMSQPFERAVSPKSHFVLSPKLTCLHNIPNFPIYNQVFLTNNHYALTNIILVFSRYHLSILSLSSRYPLIVLVEFQMFDDIAFKSEWWDIFKSDFLKAFNVIMRYCHMGQVDSIMIIIDIEGFRIGFVTSLEKFISNTLLRECRRPTRPICQMKLRVIIGLTIYLSSLRTCRLGCLDEVLGKVQSHSVFAVWVKILRDWGFHSPS